MPELRNQGTAHLHSWGMCKYFCPLADLPLAEDITVLKSAVFSCLKYTNVT